MSSATARLSDIEVQKRHSRWGIASTVMGFLSIVLAGALWGLAAYAGNSDNPTVNTIVVTLFIAGGFINLTGLLVGLGSLLQHDRKRLFPIVGLSLNLLVIVSMSVTIAFAIGEGGEVGALIQEGQQLEQDGDYDAAIDAYNNAIDHNPDHGDAYFYRAGAHFQLANNAAAVSDARRATELNPDNAEYQARLCIYGSLLDSVEIEPDILQACERAVELDLMTAWPTTDAVLLALLQGISLELPRIWPFTRNGWKKTILTRLHSLSSVKSGLQLWRQVRIRSTRIRWKNCVSFTDDKRRMTRTRK
jgi:hypothetical protein